MKVSVQLFFMKATHEIADDGKNNNALETQNY